LYSKYQIIFNKIQKKAVTTYGTNFSTNKFYSVIAQDTSFIEKMNTVLNSYDLQIDFYPRKRDIKGKWIIDTVFLVFRENKQRK